MSSYIMLEGMFKDKSDKFKILSDEIIEHVERGTFKPDDLSECDKRTVVKLLLDCMSGEQKHYFITESNKSDELLDAFAFALEKRTNPVQFMELMIDTAFDYYKDWLDDIFEHSIFVCNSEHNDNCNSISDVW